MKTDNKIIDTALDVVTNAAESWQKNLNELMSKGTISKIEGSKLLQAMEEKMKTEQEKYTQFTKGMLTSFKNSLTNPEKKSDKSPEVLALEERINVLELKMSLMTRELMTLKSKPAVKKKTPIKKR